MSGRCATSEVDKEAKAHERCVSQVRPPLSALSLLLFNQRVKFFFLFILFLDCFELSLHVTGEFCYLRRPSAIIIETGHAALDSFHVFLVTDLCEEVAIRLVGLTLCISVKILSCDKVDLE